MNNNNRNVIMNNSARNNNRMSNFRSSISFNFNEGNINGQISKFNIYITLYI